MLDLKQSFGDLSNSTEVLPPRLTIFNQRLARVDDKLFARTIGRLADEIRQEDILNDAMESIKRNWAC